MNSYRAMRRSGVEVALVAFSMILAGRLVGAQTLPVKSVTLFSSGVGYTERSGEITGAVTMPLMFRTGQINDILKSLVQIDANGKVLPATYAAKDPISRTLASFAVDVSENLTQEELFNKLRGVQVTVSTSNKGSITGQIVGIEKKLVTTTDKHVVEEIHLNLVTESGLISVHLEPGMSVKLLDARLNRELKEALELLASGSDDQRRQVTLHFGGSGTRQVRVGYITEAPLWKMSYRLTLPNKATEADGKPYMQGWALVENTSDEDWVDVNLSLVSGRPVSFIEELYQPLYLPRPTVQPSIIASPFPQTHGGSMEGRDKSVAMVNRPQGVPGAAGEEKQVAVQFGAVASDRFNRAPAKMAKAKGDTTRDSDNTVLYSRLDLNGSAVSQATGQATGELFQYKIKTPVSLPRRQAAMIPVITQNITADKVSLFNADSDPKWPLNAVRVTNNTGQHLKSGPVTIFDEGVYAGDARMDDIPPFDNRLLSYAVDLAVEGAREEAKEDIVDTSYQVKAGVLIIRRRNTRETVYKFKSRGAKSRSILVEHPKDAGFKLLAPLKASETTANLYRFKVNVAAGKAETLKVVEVSPVEEEFAVFNGDINVLGEYSNKKTISPAMRVALQEIVQRRRRVQNLKANAAANLAEIKSFDVDQERIRKNMGALDKASSLYKRYAMELDNQETRIQKLRQESTSLRNQAAEAERQLKAYTDHLNIS